MHRFTIVPELVENNNDNNNDNGASSVQISFNTTLSHSAAAPAFWLCKDNKMPVMTMSVAATQDVQLCSWKGSLAVSDRVGRAVSVPSWSFCVSTELAVLCQYRVGRGVSVPSWSCCFGTELVVLFQYRVGRAVSV